MTNKKETLKIVTWNCKGKFIERFEKFEENKEFEADVYVIQECLNPTQSDCKNEKFKDFSKGALWSDSPIDTRFGLGLGIFGKNIKNNNWERKDQDLGHCISFNVDGKINLLGIWGRWYGHGCVADRLYDYLKNADKLDSDYIIVGDMNIDAKYPTQSPECKKQTGTVFKFLNEDKKLVSAYHTYFQEDHAKETKETFYFRKNKDKGTSHIDYVFVNKNTKIINVKLGDESWLNDSDHVPLFVEIELP